LPTEQKTNICSKRQQENNVTANKLKRAEQLRKILEDEIASNQLKQGTRLEEESLAKRFGVSRTPIREALQMLSASGLVEIRPRRGAVVASLRLENLLEMFEVMAEQEALCGRLAARRMFDEERQALQKQHEICEQAGKSNDADLYYEENSQFHHIIYVGTHNQYLATEVARLQHRLRAYRRLQLRLRGRMASSFAEHSAITQAIVNGDEQKAGELLRSHVSVQGECFDDWLSNLTAARLMPVSVAS